MGLITLLASAAEGGKEASHDYTPFYIVGGVLAAFAVLLSAFGWMRPDFPKGDGPARAVMALGVVLAGSAMATAVYVTS